MGNDHDNFTNTRVSRELFAILKDNAANLDMPTSVYVEAVLRDAIRTGSIDAMAIRTAGTDHKRRAKRDPLEWVNLGNSVLWKGPGRWMHVDDLNNIWILAKRISGPPQSKNPLSPDDGWWVWREGSHKKTLIGWVRIREAKEEAARIIRKYVRDHVETASS